MKSLGEVVLIRFLDPRTRAGLPTTGKNIGTVSTCTDYKSIMAGSEAADFTETPHYSQPTSQLDRNQSTLRLHLYFATNEGDSYHTDQVLSPQKIGLMIFEIINVLPSHN